MGPGFGWGSNGFPPPPKKKSKAPWIILPIALVALGVVGLAAVSNLLKHNDDDYTAPEPTYSSTYEPTEEPTNNPTTAKVPTTRPTQPQPTKTKTTPPPPSDADIVTKNRFYKTGKQRTVNCRESGARPNSAANTRKYYNNLLSCLDRAWPKQIALGGGRFVAPRIIAFTGPTQTPCSGNAPSSFYCSVNRTIYMDVTGDMQNYRKANGYGPGVAFVRADMTDTVTHEFGHHIQNMTGILDATQDLEYDVGGDKALELNRRLELQATCFGHVFLAANKGSYKVSGQLKTQLDYLNSHQGDEYGTVRDHGSRVSYARWARSGFATGSTAACNTYVAAAKYVK